MAGPVSEVPQIYLQQPHSSAASDDLERLSTAGNLGLLRSMSARTVESFPGGEGTLSHNSSGGSGFFLSPQPGGGGASVEPMTARSTSCPSMSYQQTLPYGYHPFCRASNPDEDDINLEGEIITDLPVEPTRTFPDLISGLELQMDGEQQNGMCGGEADNGNAMNNFHSHGGFSFNHGQSSQEQNPSRFSRTDTQEVNAQVPLYSSSYPQQFYFSPHQHSKLPERGQPDVQKDPLPVYPPQQSASNFSSTDSFRFSSPQTTVEQNHRTTRDYGTNPEMMHHHHRERAPPPVFAQSHSHTHRAVTRSNGCHGDIPEYNYIRYHRQGTKDTESSGAEVHRSGSYHRQSTKDSSTSIGDSGVGGFSRQATCNSSGAGEYTSGARRSTRRRSGKHSSTSGSSQRQSCSSQTSDPLSPPSAPGGATSQGPGGSGAPEPPRSPGRVINIRDLPSSVAREVMAEKAHTDKNSNVDVQEKCLRWLSSLHVSSAQES